MKPWEETWYPYEDTAGELDVYRDIDTEGSRVRVLASDSARDEDKARAKLAAAAPEMARLLLDVQFTSGYDGTDCHWCSGARPYDWDGPNESKRGHKERCPFVAVLVKAGVLPSGDT